MSALLDTVDAAGLHARLARRLDALRRPDGGFATGAGRSEVEPTVVAALALRDRRSAAWVARRQRADGGFDELGGRPASPTVAALAALVLEDGRAARRALASAVRERGLPLPNAPDPNRRTAWGWTSDARSLTEPTARVLLAAKALTPRDAATRAEALRLLEARQCADGGWNFGNASVYDVDLRGYAQTTAIALLALQGEPAGLVGPGIAFLRRQWRHEPGALTAAQALVAFRLHRVEDERAALLDALAPTAAQGPFLGKPLVAAWATLATGPDALLEPLRPWR